MGSIHHGDPKTLRDLFKSELWRGRDNLRVSFRRPIAWASLPSAIIPICHVALFGVLLVGLLGTPLVGRVGLVVAAAAIAGCIAATAPRVVRAAARERQLGFGTFVQAFAVAGAYDIGRALAVVSRAPHRAVRAPHMAATS